MRPTSFPSQKIREDNFLKEIGRLQRGPHSQSFELLSTLVNHSRSQRIGSGLVPVTLGTPAFWRSIGLQLILTGEPSTSTESSTCLNHTGRDLAKAIIRAEEGDKVPYGILDSSCWHQRGMSGPSIAEETIREGLRWRPSDRTAGARVAGKNRLHEVLKVDEYTDRPGLIIFNTCRQILADLPVIPSDPRGSDDIDPRYASDHSYDSLRYGVMSREQANSQFGDRKAAPAYGPADVIFGY